MKAPLTHPLTTATSRAPRAPLPAGRSRHGGRARSATAAYLPLNVHSYYSFLNSTLSIQNLVDLAARHGLPALALADDGNLHGAPEFVLAARQAGLKPVLGARVRVGGLPALLYIENAQGYRNLCRLLSLTGPRGSTAAPVAQPFPIAGSGRVSRPDSDLGAGTPREPAAGDGCAANTDLRAKDLEGSTDGLLAVSANPLLAPLFPGRFYFAVTSRDTLRRAPDKWPCVPALPCRYAVAADRWKFDVVQSIRTLTLLHQAHPDKIQRGQLHFRPPEEMEALFGGEAKLLARTREIAERCSFEFPFGKPQFPAFSTPDGSTPRAFLRRLVLEGLQRRYGARTEKHRAQVVEELEIIGEVGYEEYFLGVWEILQECRRAGIEWITRGSAADSLVCYCLGISSVCPIRFDLYFRRFLNRDRMALNKLPDIDVDFAHDRKDDVVELIFKKYGPNQAAAVGGFSTYQARGAVGDVAKVLGVSEFQIRRITERLPHATAAGLIEAMRERPECRDLPVEDEPYKTAIEMAGFLDGFPRYPKMHPCGIVLSRQPMHELTPTFMTNKGWPATHYDMDAVELIGLVKMDILAQGGLAAMRDVKGWLGARGVAVDLDALEPWIDPEVWKMIADGGARAVHHIESPAMVGLCRRCNVREIDGLVAIVSVIRPGAANEQKKLKFTRRYQGLEPVSYPHASLEECLRSTYGLVVYEEHILQICEAFAGLAPGRADVLRRALAKEKPAVIEEIRREFFAAAAARGHDAEKIAEVWGLVSGFAGYAFCKAHSTAYGVEAYQSAWLKRHYPLEFMAAVLSNGKGFYHPLVYVLECHRLGIALLPPAVNAPGPLFEPVPSPAGHIRVPVRCIKGLTAQTSERILGARRAGPFPALADFYRRVNPLPGEMELLLRAGAFDEFGRSRAAQFWECQFLQRAFAGAEGGQDWLLPPPGMDRLPDVPLREPGRRERLEAEADLFGFPVSGHPLELHDHIAWETYCPVARLGDHVGGEIVTCGLVIEQRTHHQVTGEVMKFLTLADWTGMVETELFAQTYRSYGLATVRYPVLEITAAVEPFENGRGYSLRVLRAGKPREKIRA